MRNAHDRMAPMLRFFRHGDGALALFKGGQESDPKMMASLLARDEVRGQPFRHARHSGYQRLAAGRTLIQLDCGEVPQGALCAAMPMPGFLAFEMSSGGRTGWWSIAAPAVKDIGLGTRRCAPPPRIPP